jgi:hypothetical protein
MPLIPLDEEPISKTRLVPLDEPAAAKPAPVQPVEEEEIPDLLEEAQQAERERGFDEAVQAAKLAATEARDAFGPDSEEFKREFSRFQSFRTQATPEEIDAGMTPTGGEAALLATGKWAKAAAGGISFGLTDIPLDKLEKAYGVSLDPSTPSEQVALSLTRLGTGVITGMGLAKGVGNLTAKLGLQGAKAVFATRMTASGLQSAINSISQVATGDSTPQRAAGNLAQAMGAALVGFGAENAVPAGVKNWVTQVVADLAYDMATDIGLRNRLQDQSFAQWFVNEELPQMVMSIAFATRDLTDKNFEAQRQAVRSDIKGWLSKDVQAAPEQFVAKTEPVKLSTVAPEVIPEASKPRPNEPEAMAAARANTAVILDTLPKSTIGRFREKDIAEGGRDASMRIEDAVGQALDRLGGMTSEAGTVGRVVDGKLVMPGGEAQARPAKPAGGAGGQVAAGTPEQMRQAGYIPVWRGTDERGFNGVMSTEGGAQGSGVDFYTDPLPARSHATGKGGVIAGWIPASKARIAGLDANVAHIDDAADFVMAGKIVADDTFDKTGYLAKANAALQAPAPSAPVLAQAGPGQAGQERDARAQPEWTAETFGQQVDRVVSEMGVPEGQLDIRKRLNRFGQSKALNEYAKAKGYAEQTDERGRDVTRRALSEEELLQFASENGIRFGNLRDKDTVADILKVSFDAESPEEAMREYNRRAQLAGRPLITDISELARGGAPIQRSAYTPSEAERADMQAAMPRNLRGTPQGDAIAERLIAGMKHGLSQDPKSRRMELRMFSKLARQAEKGDRQTKAGEFRQAENVLARANDFESMRYVFAEIAARSGDQRIFDLYRDVDLTSRRSTKWVEDRLDEVFRQVGVQTGEKNPDRTYAMKLRYYVQGHPEVGDAIKNLIGTDPNTSGKIGKARIAEAEKVIDGIANPKHKAQVKALVNSIMTELQSVSATNVRMLQVYRFGDFWNEAQKDGRTWGEHYLEMRELSTSRTPAQERRFGALEAQLDKVLPRWHDGKSVQKVDTEEMIAKYRLWQERGAEPLRADLDGWAKGTRKYYWMTERDVEDFQLLPRVQDTPGYGRKAAEKTVKETGVVNPRTGLGVNKSGDLLATLYKHMHILQTQADTYHAANELRGKIGRLRDAGRIPESVGKHTDMWTTARWGRYHEMMGPTKLFMKGNAAFWTAYPWALQRIAWYSARNALYQGMPWGPLAIHYRAGDIVANYPRLLREGANPQSRLRQYHAKRFASDISQEKAIFYEQMLMADPGAGIGVGAKSAKLGVLQQRIWNWSAHLVGASDSFNRLTGMTGYLIADKHVDAHLLNPARTTKADVFDKLRIGPMHLSQQRLLSDLWDDAAQTARHSPQWDKFIETVSEMKQENINYSYRISGKSAAEQDPNWRPFLGIFTYARGQINEMYRNGLQPLAQAARNLAETGDMGNLRDVERAGGVLAKSIVAHALSSAVMGWLIGKKREGITKYVRRAMGRYEEQEAETQPAYGVLTSALPPIEPSPGYDLIQGIRSAGILATYHILNLDPDSFLKHAEWFVGEGVWYTPVLSSLIPIAEATQNRAGIQNIEFLTDLMNKRFGGTLGRAKYRDTWAKWVKAVFDTEKDDRSFSELLLDSDETGIARRGWEFIEGPR